MGAQTTARSDIMTVMDAIVAAWTDYPLLVEAEDRDVVDQSSQTNPYVTVEIRNLSAIQKDLADRPLVEQRGQILITVMTREGTGTVVPNKLIDFITPYFDMKAFSLVRTHPVEIYPAKYALGWRLAPMLINFWYNRLST